MGVLATGYARARPGARVCRVHLPQPLQSHIQSYGTLGRSNRMNLFVTASTQPQLKLRVTK
jgi:hypothetical protein